MKQQPAHAQKNALLQFKWLSGIAVVAILVGIANIKCSMENVPNEVVRMFLEEMTPEQRRGVARTSKTWNYLANTFPPEHVSTKNFEVLDETNQLFYARTCQELDGKKVTVKDSDGNSLLHRASTPEVARCLVEGRGFAPDIMNENTKDTPLLYVLSALSCKTQENLFAIAEYLLQKGANPNHLNNSHLTALDIVTITGCQPVPKILKLLLDYNGRPQEGLQPDPYNAPTSALSVVVDRAFINTDPDVAYEVIEQIANLMDKKEIQRVINLPYRDKSERLNKILRDALSKK